MSRAEFSDKVRKAAWERCKGRCEAKGCNIKLMVGHFQYDHIVPDGLGGEPTLENCAVLCSSHHSVKTHTVDRPMMQKADNIKAKHLGFKKRGGKIRGRPFSRRCAGCDSNFAELPSKLCPGCQAYREHQQ